MTSWGVVLGVGGASAALALWMRSLGIFSAGAAMIALRANAAAFGPPPSLEALGFDLPPLPIVLAMPVAALPGLGWDPFAAVVVSALAAGVAAWWLLGSLRAMGLGAVASAAIAAGVVFHPAWLYAAASGSGSVLAAALLVAGLRLYRRWQRGGEALAILASSFAVALAGLARYDLFVVGWAIAVLVWLKPVPPARRPYSDPRSGEPLAQAQVLDLGAAAPRSARLGDEQIAFGIAYAAAVTGALGLWLVTTGLLTGDVLAFVARSSDAVAAPPTAHAPVHALLVLIPALAAAAIAALMRQGAAAVIATGVIAVGAAGAAIVSGSPLSLDAVLPLVPLTGLLVGEIVAARRALRPLLSLAVPALVGSGALALALSPDWGEGHRAAAEALAGRARPMWDGEREVATFVRASGGRVVLDARIDAVAALLVSDPRSGGPPGGNEGPLPRARVLDLGAAAPRSARPGDDLVAAGPARPGDEAPRSARPGGGPDADLVLVRTPTGRGAAHRVAAAWPTLYGGGAPWATLAGSWPVSGEPAEYRLYAVLPVAGR